MIKKTKTIQSAFLLFLLFSACNVSDINLDNDFEVTPFQHFDVLKLGKASYTISDLLDKTDLNENDSVEVSSNMLINFIYRDTFQTADKSSILEEPEIEEANFSVSLPTTPPAPIPVTIPVNEEFFIEYISPNRDIIDSSTFSLGEMVLSIVTNDKVMTDYTLSMSGVKNNSDNSTLVIMSTGSNIHQIDLSKHTMIFEHVLDTNFLRINLQATVVLPPGETLIGTEEIRLGISSNNVTFQTAYGEFAPRSSAPVNENIDLDLFREFSGGINFRNPTVDLDFYNEFGIPLAINLDGLYGDDGTGNNIVRLNGGTQAIDPAVSITEGVSTLVSLDNNNSDIDQLIASTPNRIVLEIGLQSNPDGIGTKNFLNRDASLGLITKVVIPAELQVTNLTRKDTVEITEELNDVDSVYFRFISETTIPLSSSLSMWTLDRRGNRDYTFLEQEVLKGASVNANGETESPAINTYDYVISKEGIQALNQASNLVWELSINTSDNEFVKIFADDYINLEVGMGIHATITIE